MKNKEYLYFVKVIYDELSPDKIIYYKISDDNNIKFKTTKYMIEIQYSELQFWDSIERHTDWLDISDTNDFEGKND